MTERKKTSVEFPVFETLKECAEYYTTHPLPRDVPYRNALGEAPMTEPYTSIEELTRVYNLIEKVLPEGWGMDQRSEYIEITWPDDSPENITLRSKIVFEVVEEIQKGRHKYLIGDRDAFDGLIERRIEEAKESGFNL